MSPFRGVRVAPSASAGSDTTTAREREARARLGVTLRSKWHLDALLGIGGMAAVYAATHRNGMRGAVKIMHVDAREPEARHRFLREGRIANHVRHDGIVSVLDDDVAEDGSPFLVMELLEGESFCARAARTGNKLSFDVVLLLTDQVLDALAAAHDKGIVHRDIKPENLFVTTDARVKVLDFGIAHLEEPLDTQLRATQVGLAMGTPAFMAPEQARGRWDLVGPESDLWSLGATMFTLLTGDFVHAKESLHESLAATITQPAPSLAAALPGAPPRVVEIVDRALQLKLADRWHDAREMQAAVRAAYREMTGEDTPPLPARRTTADDSGAHRVVSRRDLPTIARAVGTISSVATQLAANAPRARQRGAVVLTALVAVIGVGLLVGIRTSPSVPLAAAQRLDLSALTAQPPSSAVPIEPAIDLPLAIASGSAIAKATAVPPIAAPPIVPTARPPEHQPKNLFDRRR